ncbi:MAG: response regulator transcription factor [Proteobacteria bacterium]|nr:MAG: response regulator transcription factor [Pseudomonadota bacterium]
MTNVLVIEDREENQTFVKRALANASVEISVLKTFKEAAKFIRGEGLSKISMIILDLDLPDGDGLELLEDISRVAGDKLPVFIWTHRDQLDDRVTAFNLGADDYLPKTMSGVEFRARVQMRLKKCSVRDTPETVLSKGDIKIDTSILTAFFQKGTKTKPIGLTAKEFRILALLMKHEGRVFTRQDLVKLIWGDSVHVLERTIDSHIFGLRKKLENHSSVIECIPNVGYRFAVAGA